MFSAVSHRVSKRPIWLADAAHPEAALPPTTHRIAGALHDDWYAAVPNSDSYLYPYEYHRRIVAA